MAAVRLHLFTRVVPAIVLFVLTAPVGVQGGPEPRAERKPVADMKETDRDAALEEAKALDHEVLRLYLAARYLEAEPLARRIVALRERFLGPEDPAFALALLNLGAQLDELGRYPEARALYERALRIWEDVHGPEHPRIVTALGKLGMLLRKVGEYDAAMPLCERALALSTRVHGPEHSETGICSSNLAFLLTAMGRHRESLPHFERALRIYEEAFGPEHRYVASGLTGLAMVYAALGRHERAQPLYERALAIQEKVLGPTHPTLATTLNNLAMLHDALGRPEEARPLLERAIGVWEAALGGEHPEVAAGLVNLGTLLLSLRQYEEALPVLERALELNVRAYGPEHPHVATTLNNLGVALKALGRYEAALDVYERAAAIRERTLGADHPDVVMSISNLAALLRMMDRAEEALPLLERALRLNVEHFGERHPRVSTSLNNLASVLGELGEIDRASELYEQAMAIAAECLGADHPEVALGLSNQAVLLARRGRWQAGALKLARSLDLTEADLRRSFVGLPPRQRLEAVRDLRQRLAMWLEFAPHVDRTGYEEVLRFKGLVTRVGSAERRLARLGGDRVAEPVEKLRAVERLLGQLANRMPPWFPAEGREERLQQWREAYARVGAARDALAASLARDFAPLREGLERLELDLADVQASLGGDTVLLDVLCMNERYLAWLVRPGLPVERIDLGAAAAIDEAVAVFAERTADENTGIHDAAWLAAGRTLADLVLTPVLARLDETADVLVISPDAALATVPFAALPGRDRGRFLIDDFLLVQVSMAQDLVPWSGREPVAAGALAVGGVDYGRANAASERPLGPASALLASAHRAPRGGTFVALPETRTEALFVKERLGEACAVLLGADATEARLRTQVRGRGVLHLATHGFVRDDLLRGLDRPGGPTAWLGADEERQLAVGYDPMLLAGLALAGANTREGGGGDDGILTAAEASYLDLDGVGLVVLSACETALGRATSGEGVMGLVQGFQMAGARTVVASLWQVDDEATRVLMEKLYAGLRSAEEPRSAAQALRDAALFVRSSVGQRDRSLSAPRFWAGFVCYGR